MNLLHRISLHWNKDQWPSISNPRKRWWDMRFGCFCSVSNIFYTWPHYTTIYSHCTARWMCTLNMKIETILNWTQVQVKTNTLLGHWLQCRDSDCITAWQWPHLDPVPRSAAVSPPPVVPRSAAVSPPPVVPRSAAVSPPPVVPRSAAVSPPPVVPRSAAVSAVAGPRCRRNLLAATSPSVILRRALVGHTGEPPAICAE